MAYENFELENLSTGLVSGDLDSWASYHDPMTNGRSSPQVGYSPYAGFGSGISFYPDDWYNLPNDAFAYGDEQAGLRIKIQGYSHYVYLWVNGLQYGDYLCTVGKNPYGASYKGYYARTLYLLLDETQQKGSLMIMERGWDGSWGNTAMNYALFWNVYRTQRSEIYQWAKRLAPPPLYNWQSVPSISGKNGILNLSQIASASINNGESVTGASASAFTSLTAQVSTMVTDDSEMSGADAGGISGSGSNSGNQSSGYAFGQGESGTNVSGGGGGYYGGEKGGSLLSGGAGSGYIGNSLVSNKKMVGYNVPTSSAEATKTESVNVYSAAKEANKPKAGNGFARIKFLRNPASIWKTTDISHCKTVSWNGSWSSLSEWYGTDWILSMNNSNANYFSSFDGTDGVGTNKSGVTNCTILIPINRVLLERFKVKAGLDAGASGAYSICQLGFMKLENGELQSVSGSDINADNVSPIQQYTKVLETPQYADYFLVNVCDGKWHFQDLELNY